MRVCVDQAGLSACRCVWVDQAGLLACPCVWGGVWIALIDWEAPAHCTWPHRLHLGPGLCKREPELRDDTLSLSLC